MEFMFKQINSSEDILSWAEIWRFKGLTPKIRFFIWQKCYCATLFVWYIPLDMSGILTPSLFYFSMKT